MAVADATTVQNVLFGLALPDDSLKAVSKLLRPSLSVMGLPLSCQSAVQKVRQRRKRNRGANYSPVHLLDGEETGHARSHVHIPHGSPHGVRVHAGHVHS